MEVSARHGDVRNYYVKAEKDEDLENVLHVPQGMEFDANKLGSLATSNRSKMELRITKGLYGLKQAERLWEQLLHAALLKMRFIQCHTDSC